MTDPQVAPQVSIVIVNWNARAELVACLRSLEASPPTGPWEAIIVDNGSHDDSVRAVHETAPWARVIANPVNRGLAGANNQGIAEALGQTVVISNPDVLFKPGSVDALVDLLERRSRAAFAFARLLDADGSVQTSAGALPTLYESFLGRNRQAALQRTPPSPSVWWDGWTHDEEIPIGHGGEACYAVRRDALNDIGLQDERYVLDWEGFDWCARALEAGWEIWFCPRAEAVHLGSRSIRQARVRWIIASHRGMYYYFARRSSPIIRPLLALLITLRAVVKYLAVAAGRGFYSRHLNR